MNVTYSTPPTPSIEDDSLVSERIVDAVAAAEGASPLSLQPLATVVDPDALDKLVDSITAAPDDPTGVVEFCYSGYRVTVTGNGDVDLRELED